MKSALFILLVLTIAANHAGAGGDFGNFAKKKKLSISCSPAKNNFPKVQLTQRGDNFIVSSYRDGMFSTPKKMKLACKSARGKITDISRHECGGTLNGLDFKVTYYEKKDLNYGPIRVSYDQTKDKDLQRCELGLEDVDDSVNRVIAPEFAEMEKEFNGKGIAALPKEKEQRSAKLNKGDASAGPNVIDVIATLREKWLNDNSEEEEDPPETKAAELGAPAARSE